MSGDDGWRGGGFRAVSDTARAVTAPRANRCRPLCPCVRATAYERLQEVLVATLARALRHARRGCSVPRVLARAQSPQLM